MSSRGFNRKISVVFLLLAAAVLMDIGHARLSTETPGKWAPDSIFPGEPNTARSVVAIVRSDDPSLAKPVPLVTPDLSYAQVEDMVRRAVDLAGGFKARIRPGNRVLIKPNLVEPQASGIGEITDVRVVKALIRVVNDVAPGKVKIVVGEGSANPTPEEYPYNTAYKGPGWTKLWDVAGYQSLLTDPDLKGIDFKLVNMNGPWEDLVLVQVPGGAYASANAKGLWIHKEVRDAEFHITVPVMKIHSPVTVALKNAIGLYPSMRYGYYKACGVPQDGREWKIHPKDPCMSWVEEEIVDMNRVAGVDFAVVDAIMCLDRQKQAVFKDGKVVNQVRRNMILAGSDLVAVDHVASLLMGRNPDDVNHIVLAAKAGLGTNDPARIVTAGSTIEKSEARFRKSTWTTFGQSCRTWLLRGPFDASGIDDPMTREFIAGESAVAPTAGKEGWSEPVYFFDDRIALGSYFRDMSDKAVAYAFSRFDAPKDQKAELWLGSDEALRIYVNGKAVYDFRKERSYGERDMVKEKISIPIRRGENTLLVKAFHSSGRFDFALNICEPERNPEFDGNRVWGVVFHTAAR